MERYTYAPSGLRSSKTVNGSQTRFVLNGSNVALEISGGTVAAKYVHGLNPIMYEAGGVTLKYLHNGRGDIVQLMTHWGIFARGYDYDAFGVERDPNTNDTNPFRYAGEYLDLETNSYYLRARYYNPTTGRFLSEDPYWNVGNMIYGTNPVKWNERTGNSNDPLGLNAYTYKPDILSIMQSGNRYVYCVNNPVRWVDPSGEKLKAAIVAIAAGAVSGAIWGAHTSYEAHGEVRLRDVAAGAVYGAAAAVVTVTGMSAATSIGTIGTVTTIAGSAGTVASSATLREAMIQSGVPVPSFQHATHHIVAGAARAAEPARQVLLRFGIGINSAINGVFLPTVQNVSNAAYHPSLHTAVYYETVNNMLNAAQSRQQVISILGTIADMLSRGTFPR